MGTYSHSGEEFTYIHIYIKSVKHKTAHHQSKFSLKFYLLPILYDQAIRPRVDECRTFRPQTFRPKRPWPKCPGRNVLGRNVRGRNVRAPSGFFLLKTKIFFRGKMTLVDWHNHDNRLDNNNQI